MAAAPPGDSRETLLAELEDARLLVATLQVANVELAEQLSCKERQVR